MELINELQIGTTKSNKFTAEWHRSEGLKAEVGWFTTMSKERDKYRSESELFDLGVVFVLNNPGCKVFFIDFDDICVYIAATDEAHALQRFDEWMGMR